MIPNKFQSLLQVLILLFMILLSLVGLIYTKAMGNPDDSCFFNLGMAPDAREVFKILMDIAEYMKEEAEEKENDLVSNLDPRLVRVAYIFNSPWKIGKCFQLTLWCAVRKRLYSFLSARICSTKEKFSVYDLDAVLSAMNILADDLEMTMNVENKHGSGRINRALAQREGWGLAETPL